MSAKQFTRFRHELEKVRASRSCEGLPKGTSLRRQTTRVTPHPKRAPALAPLPRPLPTAAAQHRAWTSESELRDLRF
jgi:hypothetical protein